MTPVEEKAPVSAERSFYFRLLQKSFKESLGFGVNIGKRESISGVRAPYSSNFPPL
jgi:hypothetical protein